MGAAARIRTVVTDMTELTKEEIAVFIKQWVVETTYYLIGHNAPTTFPSRGALNVI
jgi:hypothetical protein